MEFDLAAWLEVYIGIEEPRVRRRNLFRKLCRLAAKYGDAVYENIAQVWKEVLRDCNRSTPSRMFCKFIKYRLIDQKLWDEPQEFKGKSLAQILATGIFKQRAEFPRFDGQAGAPRATPRPGHHRLCDRPHCNGCD